MYYDYYTRLKIQIEDSGHTCPDAIKSHSIQFESDMLDTNIHGWFSLFVKVLRAQGFGEELIAMGGCQLAFNESHPPALMSKIAKMYDLTMLEDIVEDVVEDIAEDVVDGVIERRGDDLSKLWQLMELAFDSTVDDGFYEWSEVCEAMLRVVSARLASQGFSQAANYLRREALIAYDASSEDSDLI